MFLINLLFPFSGAISRQQGNSIHTASKNPHNIISKNTQYTLLPQWKLHISNKILSLREDTT
jgi:hypothetical protein